VDVEDCLALLRYKGVAIDPKRLEDRYRETASYSISEDKMIRNLELFLKTMKKELGRG